MSRLHAPLLALGLLSLATGTTDGAPPRPAQPAPAPQADALPHGAVTRLGTLNLTHAGGVTALAFAPAPKDGRGAAQLLATGGTDRTVRLWDVTTGREVRRLVGHKD